MHKKLLFSLNPFTDIPKTFLQIISFTGIFNIVSRPKQSRQKYRPRCEELRPLERRLSSSMEFVLYLQCLLLKRDVTEEVKGRLHPAL